MTPEGQRFHRQLLDLPDIAPSAMLETRILRARRKRLRRNGSILAGICLACVSLGLAPLLRHAPDSALPAPQTKLVAIALEGDDNIHLQVMAIDQALQAAYDSNARSEEIASLWRARERLIASGQHPPGSI